MGFFSGLSGILGGGSQSAGSTTSGFGMLPKQIQQSYTGYADQLNGLLKNPTSLTDMYTPLAQTAGETKAYGNIDAGFAPTADSISSDISMQNNPFNQSVIDTINREMTGNNSAVTQGLSQAGQQNSNRSVLGANDIDLSRGNQIGSFLQSQYNTALQNALTTLPDARSKDAGLQLTAGANQRALDASTKQAPVAGLGAYADLLKALPQSGGSTSTSSGSSSDSGTAGNLVSTAASLYSLFSDIRLKDNIEQVGEENGYPVYSFTYKGDDKKYIGVMAQDVERKNPEAVGEKNGYKTVNYHMIGVNFREAA